MSRGSLLLVTLPPFRGGVPAKAAILARHLRRLRWNVTVAYYATLSDDADLVVPAWQAWSGRRPGIREGTCWDGFRCYAVGCRFPELEAPYTAGNPLWRRLVAAHDRHIAVGGTALVANILVDSGTTHLTWCAASVDEDRMARVAAMPWPRPHIDRHVVRPLLLAQQRRVFASPLGSLLGVSRYTCRTLAEEGAGRVDWLPIPVDLAAFSPPVHQAPAGIVGLAGRLGDPRKRLPLLVQAVAELSRRGVPVRLRLAGEVPGYLPALVERLGLTASVDLLGFVADSKLPDFYRSLDVFALPSSQEGLGIVGVEAMACGVPVVTAARDCGPDDYVRDGVTGFFAEPDARSLADRLATVIADRDRRDAMSQAARAHVTAHFGHDRFAEGLAAAWRRRWGDEP